MTAPLTLAFDPARPGSARTRAASLPASVKLVEIAGDIAVVDGAGDWPEQAQAWIEQGASRVLVLDPDVSGAGGLAPLIDFAEARGAQVSISETHADCPAIADVRGWTDGNFAVQTITGQGNETLCALIMQQLRIARATGLQVLGIDHAMATPEAAVAVLASGLGDAPVTLRLTATRTRAGAAHHAWMAHAPDASASLTVFSGGTARPARAMRMTADGGYCPPTIYEHAHRASLRALVAGGNDGTERLRGWLEDAALAGAIAGGG